jgi:protein gp37
MAHRFSGPGQPYEGLTQIAKGHPAWTGKVELVEKHLLDPLRWGPVGYECQACGSDHAPNACDAGLTRPRRIFVNSMSDLFHESVPDGWIDRIFAVMALSPQHTFQVLTKRPERMRTYCSDDATLGRLLRAANGIATLLGGRADGFVTQDPDGLTGVKLPNVQLGVSVEDQKTADERIPLLLQTPAEVRFISAEPLLGAIRLANANEETGKWDDWIDPKESHLGQSTLDWVIVGGESGPGARPMHPDWVRSLRDQCVAGGVPFFFKQWGEWAPVERRDDLPGRPWMVGSGDRLLQADGSAVAYEECAGVGNAHPMRRVGKKAAGSLLDGREWKEFPR